MSQSTTRAYMTKTKSLQRRGFDSKSSIGVYCIFIRAIADTHRLVTCIARVRTTWQRLYDNEKSANFEGVCHLWLAPYNKTRLSLCIP